ncbi:hypothetical protein PENSTE_c001G02688 [Penicillium steckii]|uniref:Uncharacterized protein n=1 Tax=Penicillium steckii TaxID=303698 RepID=A0A1V6U274_9EURO|nr:hypothetical protein PENSTE_c001G02688 [Penicillium steckii]
MEDESVNDPPYLYDPEMVAAMVPKHPDTDTKRLRVTRSQSSLKIVIPNPRLYGDSYRPQTGYEIASMPKYSIDEIEAHNVRKQGEQLSLEFHIKDLQKEQQGLHASALLLQNTLENLQAANSMTNTAVNSLQQQFESFRTEEEELNLKIISLRQILEGLQRTHSTTSALEERIQQLESENGDLINTATSLQKQAFKNIEKGGWAPKEALPDNLIRETFWNLQEHIRLWSRKYGAEAVSEQNDLQEETGNDIVRDLREGGNGSQGYIYTDIFHPFFPFTPDPVRTTPDLPTPAQLDRIYRDMRLVNVSKAHLWRSETLRNLFFQIRYSGQQAAEHLMAKLLSGHARYLCKLDFDLGSGEAELQNIGKKAVDLAQSLWTQREFLVIGIQKKFPVFKSSCIIMIAHRLHHLDDEDERLDGKKVLLCVQPAIIAKGNQDAEDYDKIKGWAKVTMFLDETDGCNGP